MSLLKKKSVFKIWNYWLAPVKHLEGISKKLATISFKFQSLNNGSKFAKTINKALN